MTKPIETAGTLTSIDWTVEEYHAIWDAGILRDRAPVELLSGKIISMSPVGSPHTACVSNIQEEFILRFGRKFTYRTQDPISILPISEPQPDFLIAKRSQDNYANSPHPTPEQIILLIEVSESTLGKDRGIKLQLYAEAKVKEYWIFNLEDRQLEVYTQPDGDTKYVKSKVYEENEKFTHSQFGTIIVAQFLPAKLINLHDND